MIFKKEKEELFIEYSGNLEERFNRLIDRPQFWETEEGFCGRMKDNELWFYKRYPLMKNSFRTVLYGEIIDDHRISFRYGKTKGIVPFVIFADVLFFLLFIYGVTEWITTGDIAIPLIAGCVSAVVCTLLTVLCLLYPKKEKEDLYQRLKKICEDPVR